MIIKIARENQSSRPELIEIDNESEPDSAEAKQDILTEIETDGRTSDIEIDTLSNTDSDISIRLNQYVYN